MPFVSFLHESRRRIETGSRQIAYDADWPGRIVCPSLAGEEAGGKASKASQKSPGTPAHMAGALPLAKRSAQSEVARAVVDVDVYHAFTLLRKLDDDGPEGYACEMREREKDDETGLVVSCRVVSRPVVSYRVSWTCALVVVVGRPSFARVCFTRINHDYASIRFFHSGLRYVTNSTLTHARQTPRRASRYALPSVWRAKVGEVVRAWVRRADYFPGQIRLHTRGWKECTTTVACTSSYRKRKR
jgi:hypothetical protein